MTSRLSARLRPVWSDTAAVALLGALLFLPGLAATDLWNPDEPRYARVAMEMAQQEQWSGWFVPRLNGEPYTDKPPMLFWAMALFAELRGEFDEVAARLPVALAAAATLVLLFDLCRNWAGRRAAWIAVLVFGSCLNIHVQARSAQTDLLLVAFVSAAILCWCRGHLQQRRSLQLGFYLFAALATLTKGPVGLLTPLLAVAGYLLVIGRTSRLHEIRLLPGLLLWSGIVALWFLPAAFSAGGEFWRDSLFRQNLVRFAQPWGHLRPWYYFWVLLPGLFFPWFFLLPASIADGWRRLSGTARNGFLFALVWMLTTLVFFSLSPGKRSIYILTMYPAMAMLIGITLDRLATELRPRITYWIGGLATLSVLLVLLWIASHRYLPLLLPPTLPTAFAGHARLAVAGLALAATVATGLCWRRRLLPAFGLLCAASLLFSLTIVMQLRPQFNPIKSTRPLSEVVLRMASADEPLAIYPRLNAGFLFYTDRQVSTPRDPAELQRFLDQPGRLWLIARKRAMQALGPQRGLIEIERDPDTERGYLLLLRPAPDAAALSYAERADVAEH